MEKNLLPCIMLCKLAVDLWMMGKWGLNKLASDPMDEIKVGAENLMIVCIGCCRNGRQARGCYPASPLATWRETVRTMTTES